MMTNSDLIRVSLRQVLRQRSYGVIFSIALGIMAFVVLSVLGREIRYNIGQDMLLLGGVNVIRVYFDDDKFPDSPRQQFSPEAVKALRQTPGVMLVSENARDLRSYVSRIGDRHIALPTTGVDQYFWELNASTLQQGRFFTADDVERHRRVCMLGYELARDLFGDKNPVGELVFLGNEAFEVVGSFSGIMMGDWVRWVFIPHTTALDRYFSGGRVNRIFVRAVAWEDVPRLVGQIPEIIERYQTTRHLVVQTQAEQLERIKATFMWAEVLLWLGIAASLMLGGFGIWYGTFAAVRARTREVGLKKAMGGSDIDIMAQFLAEALCKAVAGGFIGIMLGFLAVEIGAYILACVVSYTALLASSTGSIVFSALIGIAGGVYPALQASRMDVVSALRFE